MISFSGKALAIMCTVYSATTSHAFTTQQNKGIKNNRVARSDMTSCMAAKDADMTDEEREVAMEKALKAMTAFSNKYTENTGTYYCSDKSIPAVVIKGLAEHKVTLGTPLCPCRFYEDKEKEAKEGYWNW